MEGNNFKVISIIANVVIGVGLIAVLVLLSLNVAKINEKIDNSNAVVTEPKIIVKDKFVDEISFSENMVTTRLLKSSNVVADDTRKIYITIYDNGYIYIECRGVASNIAIEHFYVPQSSVFYIKYEF